MACGRRLVNARLAREGEGEVLGPGNEEPGAFQPAPTWSAHVWGVRSVTRHTDEKKRETFAASRTIAQARPPPVRLGSVDGLARPGDGVVTRGHGGARKLSELRMGRGRANKLDPVCVVEDGGHGYSAMYLPIDHVHGGGLAGWVGGEGDP